MMKIIQQKYSRSRNYFSASHILPGYLKCERLHGHNYAVKVILEYQTGKKSNFFDFRVVNGIINSIIEELDHKILLPSSSPEIKIESTENNRNWLIQIKDKIYSFPQKDVKILDNVDQTTVENIAMYFHKKILSKINKKKIYPRTFPAKFQRRRKAE